MDDSEGICFPLIQLLGLLHVTMMFATLIQALWLKEMEPVTWAAAKYICEKQDFINFHLTGMFLTAFFILY